MTADVAVRSLSGVQKAALVLTTMSTDRAAAVLRNLAPEEAAEITAEMARLRSVTGPDAEQAIKAFRDQSEKGGGGPRRIAGPTPGKAVAEQLIQASFEPEKAADLIERIESPASSAAFSFLDSKNPAEVVRLLKHESPETVAFVLVQLAPEFAAKVLMAHAADRRTDVAQCVATMGTPVPEAASVVGDVLKRRARGRSTTPELDEDGDAGPQISVQPLVDIMAHADLQAEDELLAALRQRDETLAEEVRAKMLAFEDVPRVPDRALQEVLRGIDVRELALALKGAESEIAEAIKANMTERNRELLADEAADLGRVPKRQVEEARSVLVRAIRGYAASAEDFALKKVHVEGEAEAEAEAEPEDEEEYVD